MIELAAYCFLTAVQMVYTPHRDDMDRTVYADLFAFRARGIDARAFAAMSQRDQDYHDEEIRAVNGPVVHQKWVEECRWRRACWVFLAMALEAPPDDDPLVTGECEINSTDPSLWTRLHHAQMLRWYIGEDAFLAGAMPGPVPTYTNPR